MTNTYIEEDLTDALNGLTVYPDSVPTDGNYPCAVYQRISTGKIRTHSGNALSKPRFQIRCVGKTKLDSLATAYSVKTKMDLNKTNFVLATNENEFGTKENEAGNYETILDFFIWSGKI